MMKKMNLDQGMISRSETYDVGKNFLATAFIKATTALRSSPLTSRELLRGNFTFNE